MQLVTKEYVVKRLRNECIPAPLTSVKIAYVFGRDEDIIYKVFDLFLKGLLDDYKMIEGSEI